MSAAISGRINMGPIRATIVAAFAVFILPVSTSHAQFLFWPQYRSWRGDHAPYRQKHQHSHTKPELAKNAQSKDVPKGPLLIIISIADQRVSLYDNGALITRSSMSTGIPRHPTPLGVFSVISKQRWHRDLAGRIDRPLAARLRMRALLPHEDAYAVMLDLPNRQRI
jgi:hypothetical protein